VRSLNWLHRGGRREGSEEEEEVGEICLIMISPKREGKRISQNDLLSTHLLSRERKRERERGGGDFGRIVGIFFLFSYLGPRGNGKREEKARRGGKKKEITNFPFYPPFPR